MRISASFSRRALSYSDLMLSSFCAQLFSFELADSYRTTTRHVKSTLLPLTYANLYLLTIQFAHLLLERGDLAVQFSVLRPGLLQLLLQLAELLGHLVLVLLDDLPVGLLEDRLQLVNLGKPLLQARDLAEELLDTSAQMGHLARACRALVMVVN